MKKKPKLLEILDRGSKKLALFFISFWQVCISPFLGNNCRFEPTCSKYTSEAISHYGLIKGSFMGICRILRCNPFFKGGKDPLDLP